MRILPSCINTRSRHFYLEDVYVDSIFMLKSFFATSGEQAGTSGRHLHLCILLDLFPQKLVPWDIAIAEVEFNLQMEP